MQTSLTLTPETLSALAGVVLSLFFSYVPGANTWYAAQAPVSKRLIMAGLLLVVAIFSVLLSCSSILPLIVCEKAGFLAIAQVFVAALIANQTAFLISPPTDTVRQAKQNPGG